MMQPRSRPGAMLLVTVLIMGATALTIALGLALRGIGELDMGFGTNQGLETLAIADGCAEEALLRLNRSASYTGGSLTVYDGSCVISVSAVGGDTYQVSIEATLGAWVRTLRINVNRGDMTINEWVQE